MKPAARLEHSSVLRKFLLGKGQRRKSCIIALGFAFISCILSCIMFIIPNFSIRIALAYYSEFDFSAVSLQRLLCVASSHSLLWGWGDGPCCLWQNEKHQETPARLQNISGYRWAEVDFVCHCHVNWDSNILVQMYAVVQCKAIQMMWIPPTCPDCSNTVVSFENSSLKLSLSLTCLWSSAKWNTTD